MREHPLIFSAPMVRALLKGTKTQTRRIVKDEYLGSSPNNKLDLTNDAELINNNPFGHPGDQLWVKETWRTLASLNLYIPSMLPRGAQIDYKADQTTSGTNKTGMSQKWRSALFMPKHFSRIKLEIVNVRLERLTDCSESDACAEGVENKAMYKEMWESINGIGSWATNPWVWVLEFKKS